MDAFTEDAFYLLRQFPKDLFQLHNSEKFFESSCYSNYKKGLNIFSFPSPAIGDDADDAAASFQSYSQQFNDDIVRMFFIDATISRHRQVANMLRKIPFSYYLFVGNITADDLLFYDQSHRIIHALDFIDKLQQQLSAIAPLVSSVVNFQLADFKLATSPASRSLNPRYPTHLADNNFYLFNQILGNFWNPDATNEIESQGHIWDKRVAFQVAQIREMDGYYRKVIGGKYVTRLDPELPPLVIAAPYHFPISDHGEQKKALDQKQRDIKVIVRSEQNLNYTYSPESERVERLGKTATDLLAGLTAKLIMLDKFSYLHAMMSLSPYFRLPIIGKSINADLSHFLGNFPQRKSAVQKITEFGTNLQARVLDPLFRELLKERNGQLVVVSDLPIEWIKLDQYPLALSHDICRIPEFNFNSLLNNVIFNQRFHYRIKDDIISKTLVVHCAGQNDEIMRQHFCVIDEFKDSIGFNSVTCTTVAEVKAAVEKYRPELLIFDCHGGFDKKTSSSFLAIDGNKKVYLTGEKIVIHKISAPLVFISACSTSPNYGFVKQLSDAFFEAGAFSVTATYLPIAVKDATMLVIRLLNNLKHHATEILSSNWLAFVCHTMRATVVYDAIQKEVEKNRIPADYDKGKVIDILTDLMIFDKRLEAFEQIRNYLKSINPMVEVDFSQLNNEWLSYTTMGRADLLYFENWEKAHVKMHLGDAVDDA